MNIADALVIIDTYLGDRNLSNLQEIIFMESWRGRTYAEIASSHRYDPVYIRQLGLDLWRRLSHALGEKVSKSNFKTVLGRHHRQAQLNASLVAGRSLDAESDIDTMIEPAIVAELAEGNNASNSDSRLPRALDWGEAPHIPLFVGRQTELDVLRRWILPDRCQLIGILGMGGVGKTATVVQCVQTIQDQFQYVLWISLRDAPTFATFALTAIQFFSDQQALARDLPADPQRCIQQLMGYLKQARCLLVMDNVESILQQGDRCGHYRPGYEPYGTLWQTLGLQRHQSCVLMTSREIPLEISQLEGESLPVRCLHLSGLAAEAGRSVVERKGTFSGTAQSWQQLVELYSGNPLALGIAATSIRDLFQSDIPAFLQHAVFIFDDINDLLDTQFDRLSTLEQQIMYWLAIEREPVTLEELETNMLSASSRRDLFEAVKSLVRRSLIQQTELGFTQQPVVMEYLVEKLRHQLTQELVDNTPELFLSHALTRASANEYVQHRQQKVLLEPIVQQLLAHFGNPGQLEQTLQQLLALLREKYGPQMGYGAGNILSLCQTLGADIRGYDLSGLTIRQINLGKLPLQNINFQNTRFDDALFTSNLDEYFAVALAPQGRVLAAGSSNGQVTLWDLPHFSAQRRLKGHDHWITALTFSPDGQWLATASFDHTVRIWQVATTECLAVLTEHSGQVNAVNFSPEGTHLVSAGHNGEILLWEVGTWRCVKKILAPDEAFSAIAFHPDGHHVAVGLWDGLLYLYDLETGARMGGTDGHAAMISAVVYHPDGQQVFTSSHDRTIKVWHGQTVVCLDTLVGHTGHITELACVQQGQLLASCSHDQTIRLWDTQSRRCLRVLEGHRNDIWGLAGRLQDAVLASISLDHSIRLWDGSTGQPLKTVQGGHREIWSVAFSPDGRRLVSGGENGLIRVWDADTQRCLQTWTASTHEITSVAIHPDGKLLASTGGDRTVKIWDIASEQCLHVLRGYDDWLWSVAFSPNGEMVAAAGRNEIVRIWETATGQRLQTLNTAGEHSLYVWSIAFSPDSRWLATGSYDHTIRLWDTQTGACGAIFVGHDSSINAVGFSPDNTLLASADDNGEIKIWQRHTGECLYTWSGHEGSIWSLTFSPQGDRLASTGFDGTIRLWDMPTGRCQHILQGHRGHVHAAAFHPKGHWLASSSRDYSIRLWAVETGECLAVLRPPMLYEGVNIAGATGLSEQQRQLFLMLGAVEEA